MFTFIRQEDNCYQYKAGYAENGEPIASCSCLIYRNSKAKVMLVDDVLVEEKYRGKGYGSLLMQEIMEFAKYYNVDSVELTVNRDNDIAWGLYQKEGFEETDKRFCRRILNVW